MARGPGVSVGTVHKVLAAEG
ncbi:hypothetical protein [Corynebacterium nuruki]